MSYKIVFPILVGVTGVTAATATTLATGVFSSPKKCWYDDEKAGSFWEEVDKVINEKFDNKTKSQIKDFIKTLCTVDPKNSLTEFKRKFDFEEYSDVFDLLIEKWLELEKPENLEQDEESELETVL